MIVTRVKNSIYNVITNIIVLFTKTILSFVTRTIFIRILGKEILGLDGLFINILSMLSLTELGVGLAINYSLYEPLVQKDIKKLNAIVHFNKKIYQIIGFLIFIIGLILIPFLPYLTKGYAFDNVLLIYILYLLDTSLSYLITFKENIIVADQKGYKLGIFDTIFTILMYVLQIIFLITTKDYIIYLLISIIIKLVQKICKNIYISKHYRYIDFNSKEVLDVDTKEKIKKNVKSLFFHKTGNYLLNGTDNIIISTINISLVGVYVNYLSVISIFNTFINSICNGVLSSFGNLIVTENSKTQENVFNISNFACFIVCGLITAELLLLFNPFIEIWIGKDYLLQYWIVIIISLNFYFYSAMVSLDVIKKASGLYNIDKYIPLIQSIVNIIVSIVLSRYIGIGGVILGTFVSYLLIPLIFEPTIIYKNIFKKSAIYYYLMLIKNLFVLAVTFMVSNRIMNILSFEYSFITLIVYAIIIAIIYLILLALCNYKSYELKYILNMLKKKSN